MVRGDGLYCVWNLIAESYCVARFDSMRFGAKYAWCGAVIFGDLCKSDAVVCAALLLLCKIAAGLSAPLQCAAPCNRAADRNETTAYRIAHTENVCCTPLCNDRAIECECCDALVMWRDRSLLRRRPWGCAVWIEDIHTDTQTHIHHQCAPAYLNLQ